jgi:CPA2 family monovalent cation:H+ antiporter-2
MTLDNPASADRLVAAARPERQDLLIIARARDAAHAVHLYRLGASDAVPETIEVSFQLSEAVLVDVCAPMGAIIASILKQRKALQDVIGQLCPT